MLKSAGLVFAAATALALPGAATAAPTIPCAQARATVHRWLTTNKPYGASRFITGTVCHTTENGTLVVSYAYVKTFTGVPPCWSKLFDVVAMRNGVLTRVESASSAYSYCG